MALERNSEEGWIGGVCAGLASAGGDRHHLQIGDEQEDLVVIADEHHTYYGPAFSDAVRDLGPLVLIGLTGTPHGKTPDEQVIYRYPLANAIADRYVKTPVIVGAPTSWPMIERSSLAV